VEQAGPPPREVTIVAHDIGPVGGMERVLLELIIGLHELGYQVTVIARTCRVPAGAVARFRRIRAPSRPFLLAFPWFLVLASFALARPRRRRGIVQATGGIVLAPVDVISVHYCHQVGPTSPSRDGRLFRLNSRVVARAKRFSERLCFNANRGATFVCVSEGVAREVRENYPALAERVITIHNGVDTERFAPGAHSQEAAALRAHLDIPGGRLLAAFVGGEWERKGLRSAIAALASAPGWSLLVAGSGDERNYRQYAQSLGVADAVRWLGVRADIATVYAAADVFVMPTAYETFSLATFEAAASGLPLLATNVNGISELIEDGRNGYLITQDANEIASRLRELAADPRLRGRLGDGARRSALAFGWAETVRRHDALYRRLEAARAHV